LRRSAWRHVFRDVWVHCEVPDGRELRLAAVRLVIGGDAFLCGLTAAWLHGIDVQDRRSELVWVGCRNGARLRARAGCIVREITVEDNDLQSLDGVAMTTPLRTAFDCARWLGLTEGVVVADALAHAQRITAAELGAYATRHRGLRGVRRVAQVCDLVEPLSESPMETRLRVLLVTSGLPRPKAQWMVHDAARRFVARLDLAYPDERLAVEYDGSFHWAQRRADDRRRDALRALGWEVIVVSAEDYYREPQALVAKVRRALAHRAA
jgi:very-short-patch-repair endonuclease